MSDRQLMMALVFECAQTNIVEFVEWGGLRYPVDPPVPVILGTEYTAKVYTDHTGTVEWGNTAPPGAYHVEIFPNV